jgi:RNA polymerase sigma-70 factor (ECF subfamily)
MRRLKLVHSVLGSGVSGHVDAGGPDWLTERNLDESADVDLARALIARNPQAPRALWRRFAPMVFSILRRTLGPGHDVEDLAQEVFLCVFEKVRALREPRALKAFVSALAVLTARGERQRLWRRRRIRLAEAGDASEKALVHVDTDGREALDRFHAVLDRINAPDRTLFVLRFVEGFGLVEVAAASGVSLATTKRRLARAWSKVILFVERDPILSEYLSATECGDVRSGRGRCTLPPSLPNPAPLTSS